MGTAKPSWVLPSPLVARPVGSLIGQIEERAKEARVTPYLELDKSKLGRHYLRSSSLSMLCPREEVIAALAELTRTETLDANSILTFEIGHELHGRLQDQILPAANLLVGSWECKNCEFIVGGQMGSGEHWDAQLRAFRIPQGTWDASLLIPRPDYACSQCEARDWRHYEQSFVDTAFRITGHVDGILSLPGRHGLGVLEAKSIGARGAKEVVKYPKMEHVLQAQLYMWFTGLQWSCVLYWDKSTYGVKALIEHFVERDEEAIELLKNTLTSIWYGIEHKKLPPGICANIKAERAMACACKAPCFA